MASPEVSLTADSRAKIRDPAMVMVWFFLTLGFLVYPQVWYYRINRELRDYGEARGDAELAESNPVMSVLAVTLGALIIIPPFVSYYRCTQRIKRAQELSGISDRLNGWILVACYVGTFILTLPGLAIPFLVQENLNKVWKQLPEVGTGEVASLSSADQALGDLAPPNPADRTA